jgi:hypothetical protein
MNDNPYRSLSRVVIFRTVVSRGDGFDHLAYNQSPCL